jgi:hypothetical protein
VIIFQFKSYLFLNKFRSERKKFKKHDSKG